MTRTYSRKRREAFIEALMIVDQYWSETLEDPRFYDLNYYDLFTRLWINRERVMRKTEVYAFMPHVSHRTAVKYVQQAIEQGYLIESTDLQDKRARTLALSPELLESIEKFIDRSIATFDRKAMP